MPGAPSATVACMLRSLFQAGTVAGLADAALRSRFLSGDPDRAGPAFAALVDRHATLAFTTDRLAACKRPSTPRPRPSTASA